jgi:hypothetical protein
MVNVATGGIANDSGGTSGATRAFDRNTGSGWFYKGTTGWLELKTYTIANPASYRYYRLNVTANNGDVVFTDLGEFELLVSKLQ